MSASSWTLIFIIAAASAFGHWQDSYCAGFFCFVALAILDDIADQIKKLNCRSRL